jgi:hypothetical protein
MTLHGTRGASHKNSLICDISVRHADPSTGGVERLTARLTVKLRRDGSILNASMTFLESSR